MAIWNDNPFEQKSSTGFGFGESTNPTWSSNPFVQEEQSSNPLVNMAKGMVRGTVYGLPESLAKSWQFIQEELGGGTNEVAKGIADWAKAGMDEGREKGAFEQAGEMIPMSVGVPLTSHAVGSAIMAIPHPAAKILGGIIRLAGMYATPVVFGLSQAQETRDTARKRGVDEGMAPYITGGIEWAGETLGNMALQRLLGPASNMLQVGKDIVTKMTASQAMKGSIGSFLKEYTLRTLPTEVITEMGQNYFEALTEREYGIRPEAKPGEEAMGAIAPTAIMTAFLGPFAKIGHNHAMNKQAQILASPVDLNSEYATGQQQNRLQIAQGISEMIPADQPQLRQQWMDYVQYKIENNQPIDISVPIDTLSLEIDKQMGDMPEENAAVQQTTTEPPAAPVAPVQTPVQTAVQPTEVAQVETTTPEQVAQPEQQIQVKEPWQMTDDEINSEYNNLRVKDSDTLQKEVDNKIDSLMKSGMSFDEADNSPEVNELRKSLNIVDFKQLRDAYNDIKQIINETSPEVDADYILKDVYSIDPQNPSGVYMAFKYAQKIATDTYKSGEALVRYLTSKYGQDNNLDMDATLDPRRSGWTVEQIDTFKRNIVQQAKNISDAVSGYFEGKTSTPQLTPQETAREVSERTLSKWAEQNPHINMEETANHIQTIAHEFGGLDKPIKASDYSTSLSSKLGIPNTYEFLGKILDKLNIPIIITNKGNAAEGNKVTDAGYYHSPDGKSYIVIDTEAMKENADLGPGHGVARAKEMFVHEGLHAVVRNAPNWKQSRQRLQQLLNSVTVHYDAAPERVKGYISHVYQYDVDEFISEAFSDQMFAQWLDSIPAEGVRNPSKTLWGKLKDIIFNTLQTFGLSKSKLDELNEVLDEVLGDVGVEKPTVPEQTVAPTVTENKTGTQELELLPSPFIDGIKKYTTDFINKPESVVPDKYVKDLKTFMNNQGNFKLFDKVVGLPWWNAKKYPAWKRAFEIFGIERPESRGDMMHNFAQIAEPFFKLEENMRNQKASAQQISDAKERINQVIIAGDALLGPRLKSLKQKMKAEKEGPTKDALKAQIAKLETENRYSDEDLKKGIRNEDGKIIKLNDNEIKVYKSVRQTLDDMFDSYVDHLQMMTFRNWRNQKWYSVLAQATGMDLNKTQTAALVGKGLNKAALTASKKIQPNIQSVFNRIENEIDKVEPKELEDVTKLYEKLSNKLQKELTTFRDSLSQLTGETDTEKLSKMSQDIFSAYMYTRPQLKQIKALRNEYRKQVAFFPRVREQGNFKTSVYRIITNNEGMPTREEQIFMGMFNTEKEGIKVHEEIMKRYGKDGKLPEDLHIKTEPAVKTPEYVFQGVNDINMQKVLDNAIENMKVKDEYFDKEGNKVNVQEYLRQLGYEAIAKQFQSRGFGRHMTHRQTQVIKGYKESDLQRVLLNYIGGMTGIMTKQIAGADFLEHMKDVSQENNPSLFEALSKYGRDQLRNDTAADKLSSKVRAFMFTWYLGGVLRPAVVQLTQNFVTGIPQHGKYLRSIGQSGVGKAETDYTKAMKDVATKNYTETEARMEAQLFTEGVTVDQYIREIYGSVGTVAEQRFDRLLRFMAIPFSKMEMFNRQSAALTRFRPAYKIALEKVGKEIDGKTFTEEDAYREAFESARTFVYDTHYAMGKANLPQLAQGEGMGTIVKTFYTFKSFIHNYALQMHQDLTNKEFKAAMHSLAYIMMFGGMAGLPFFKDLFEFIEKHFGYSFTKSIRQTLRGIGGKTLETFGMNGIPAMLGANISGSLAIGIPFMGEDSLATLSGVYGGQFEKLKRATEALGRRDWYRVASNIAPEMLRGPIVAAEESKIGREIFGTPGVSATTRGRPIYDMEGKPLSMSTLQAIIRAAGFNPTEIGYEKEMDQIIRRQISYINEKKTDAGEKYRVARLNKQPDALKNMMADVKDINQAIKDRELTKLVPKASISKIIESSKETKTVAQRRAMRYKQTEL